MHHSQSWIQHRYLYLWLHLSCSSNPCLDNLFGNDDSDFSLSPSTRHALSSILIVHPVAALLALICAILAAAAHLHSPAHSPRYLLALLILSFPTLLVTLLAFLVDILLFIPHMQWGGWITLAATILIMMSGVVTCAMRRTLVSRKARKKRIEENAEMNGQNFFATQNQNRMMTDEYPRADSPPPVSGDPNKLPQFATFETRGPEGRKSSDDRTPLNPRTPSLRSVSTNGGSRRPIPARAAEDAPPMPAYGQAGMDARGLPRDQYGNPLPPDQIAMASDLPPPGLRQQNSNGTLNSQGSRGSARSRGSGAPPPGYGRGRGGYPPRGGYGPPRGGYAPRGGYGGPPRGGPMGPMGQSRGGPQGMRGGPPPGWNGGQQRGDGMGPAGAMAAGAGAGMAAGAMMGRGHTAEPPRYDNGYDNNNNDIPPPAPAAYMPRNASPAPGPDGPIGQAIEMDERHGSASPRMPDQVHNHFGLRDSDDDVAGIVALQQNRENPMRHPSPARQISGGTTRSQSSVYSEQ